VEARRKPTDEQLAHVLEIMLRADPEKMNQGCSLFSKLLNVLMHTIPIRIAIIVERINPITASSGK
jgi:hypothetical protein